jgi:hypothetical protein
VSKTAHVQNGSCTAINLFMDATAPQRGANAGEFTPRSRDTPVGLRFWPDAQSTLR